MEMRLKDEGWQRSAAPSLVLVDEAERAKLMNSRRVSLWPLPCLTLLLHPHVWYADLLWPCDLIANLQMTLAPLRSPSLLSPGPLVAGWWSWTPYHHSNGQSHSDQWASGYSSTWLLIWSRDQALLLLPFPQKSSISLNLQLSMSKMLLSVVMQ